MAANPRLIADMLQTQVNDLDELMDVDREPERAYTVTRARFERWESSTASLIRQYIGDIEWHEFITLVSNEPVNPRAPMQSLERRAELYKEHLEPLIHELRTKPNLVLQELPPLTESDVQITKEGIYFAGQPFDAFVHIQSIFDTATQQIDIVDQYISADFIARFDSKPPGVTVRILTSAANTKSATVQAAQAFVTQYGGLLIRGTTEFHDRFVIIDGTDFYHFGASLKDLGKKAFMFSRIEEQDLIDAMRRKWDDAWANGTVIV